MPRLKIEYWQVTVEPDEAGDFEDILDDARGWPTGDQRRRFEHGEKVIFLSTLEKRRTQFRGEFGAVRHRSPGYRGDRVGQIREIVFGAGEGLAEKTAFIYDPASQILALERNRSGATSHSFAKFFEANFEDVVAVQLDAILKPQAIERFERLRRATAIQVGISGSPLQLPDEMEESATKDILSAMKKLNGKRMDLTVSVSHDWRTGKLRRRELNSMVRSLLGDVVAVADVPVLKISGRTADDAPEMIDLIADRLVNEVNLQPDEGERGLSYRARIRELQRGLNRLTR